MKRVVIIVVLVVAAAVLGLWRSHGGVRAGLSRIAGSAGDNQQGATTDEIRKSFGLKPGALVQVQGINGKVDVETSDTKTAEVYVRRTADSADSLRSREIIVEQTEDGLTIRGKQNHMGFWDHLFGRTPREDVTIKAPVEISLRIKGINGRVTTADIDGSLDVSGINGGADFGSATHSVDVSGMNGSFSLGLK